ncbi:hypothetical protein FTUN_0725 [Frigoriglobus tundricola]|uniref:Uncharacterized protein n=1 Tax=Frigoriglobus tundricola TaxID=2774151 RepID=A0A6M5YIR5_9BACT|nr:hypothetical protein FTUN_0725 [Frigoriglobus tundricola]
MGGSFEHCAVAARLHQSVRARIASVFRLHRSGWMGAPCWR